MKPNITILRAIRHMHLNDIAYICKFVYFRGNFRISLEKKTKDLLTKSIFCSNTQNIKYSTKFKYTVTDICLICRHILSQSKNEANHLNVKLISMPYDISGNSCYKKFRLPLTKDFILAWGRNFVYNKLPIGS